MTINQDERETHHVMLESMREQKEKQKQLAKRESDEVFKQMTRNVEKVRATAGDFLNSGASTILVEEHHMAWTEAEILYVIEKMNKIKQKIKGLYLNWQAEYEEAMTTEQCEDIHRFYEPQVQKYETKYDCCIRYGNKPLVKEKEFHHLEFLMNEKEFHHPRVQHQS